MSTEIKVPVLPESVNDATVASWHKKPGDKVGRDENLLDLETDKVVLEVPSPIDGVLRKITRETGETVTSGEVLGVLEEAGESAADEADEEATDKTGKTASKAEADAAQPEDAESEPKEEEPERKDDETEPGAEKARPEDEEAGSKPKSEPVLSPAARRLAQEEHADVSQLSGSGRGGRITKGDVLRQVRQGPSADARPQERVKMTRLRARIAERMKAAQNTAAILTTFNEIDLKSVLGLRSKYKQRFEQTHGVKLGLMSFFVRAVCEALNRHPIVNASLEEDEIVYHGYQDIGIAVSTERGLLVPVLRDAQEMTLADIENGIREFAASARDGSIALEDLQGGTFTITNGGTFGSLLSTPLLNPPQSAILGMHAIQERPMAVDGEVQVRPMMYVALSYDHRLIDGKDAVQFLVAVKEALEDPARMLLDI
jgi:2-oxoglutarate dehydrogenase E2 component (dihydrolipoamide succinyltransferase)